MTTLAIKGGRPVRDTDAKPWPEWPVRGKEERENLLEVFESGKWFYGDRVKEFERAFAEFQDSAYGVCCMNGTAALEMACLALGIGAGDEVIVPPFTFVATASSVLRSNAIPVFADIDLKTGNIDPDAAEKIVTARTKAIMPVHFGGLPVDMDALNNLAGRHGLSVIEDACHSWGSKWKGKGTGALGDCGAFSFQMSKNITAGEGGILLTDREEIADKARSYSNCGRGKGDAWYKHYLPGSNLRMTEMQAAILLGQLTRLEEQTLRRQENAAFLDTQLGDIPGISVVGPQGDPRVTRRSYHLYMFRFIEEEWGISKAAFLEAVTAEGAPLSIGYTMPLYDNPLFRREAQGPSGCPSSCPYYGKPSDYTKVHCPNAEVLCREVVWIKQSPLLAEQGDMQDIVDAVAKVRENRESAKMDLAPHGP